MVDTRWLEETKLLITLRSEGVVQNELNTMRNKKLVRDKMPRNAKKWPIEGTQEVAQQHKLTTKSKNIASLATVTKYLVTSDKNKKCLN